MVRREYECPYSSANDHARHYTGERTVHGRIVETGHPDHLESWILRPLAIHQKNCCGLKT